MAFCAWRVYPIRALRSVFIYLFTIMNNRTLTFMSEKRKRSRGLPGGTGAHEPYNSPITIIQFHMWTLLLCVLAWTNRQCTQVVTHCNKRLLGETNKTAMTGSLKPQSSTLSAGICIVHSFIHLQILLARDHDFYTCISIFERWRWIGWTSP